MYAEKVSYKRAKPYSNLPLQSVNTQEPELAATISMLLFLAKENLAIFLVQ